MNGQKACSFAVAETWLDRVAVIAVSGDLDILTAPELTKAIQVATREEPVALIVDLSRVTFLGVAGMNLLITAHRNAAPSTRFGVVADGPITYRPLKLLGIDAILALYRTLVDALDAFG